MNKHHTIKKILESWGRGKREIPSNNEILKREILSKIPVNFDRRFSPKRSPFVWLPFAFSIMAVFVLFFNMIGSSKIIMHSAVSDESGEGFSFNSKSTIALGIPYYIDGELSIKDTREFLKVNYNATLQTRHINDLKNKIEMIVRGSNGRVDASSGGDKSGYVSFVIPKDQLESFKIEIKDLVGTRFYNEYINSQNLLPAKQAIEENQSKNQISLNDLEVERKQIVKNHDQNIFSYQNRISVINTEISSLNIEYQSANVLRRAEITNTINQLQIEINTIQLDIITENKNFKTKINNVDIQIKNTKENLKEIQLEDNNLINNVVTVNGTISLNWISLWGMADVYIPRPILAWLLFLTAFITFLWYRYFIRVSYDSFDFS